MEKHLELVKMENYTWTLEKAADKSVWKRRVRYDDDNDGDVCCGWRLLTVKIRSPITIPRIAINEKWKTNFTFPLLQSSHSEGLDVIIPVCVRRIYIE